MLYISTVQLNGSDFWLQAKIGELIVIQHKIPDTLLFPFTEICTEAFNAHEWLTSVLFHYVMTYLGESGAPYLIGLLGGIFFFCMSMLAYRRSANNFAIAFIGGILAIATENYRHVLRPELIAIILMGIFWYALESYKSQPRITTAFTLIFIEILWVNSHGSFVLAPVLVGTYAVGTYIDLLRDTRFSSLFPPVISRRFFVLFVLTVIACLFNPFGWELLRFAVSFGGSNDLHTHIGEWTPTFDSRFHSLPGLWLAALVWLLTLTTIIYNKSKVSATDVLIFLAFTVLAFKAIRFPVYLGMVAAYVVPANIPLTWRINRTVQARLYIATVSIAIGGLILSLAFGNASGSTPFVDVTRTKLSEQMVVTISNPDFKGNVLNTMELGPELIYRTYPRLKPSVDVRIDSFGMDYLEYQVALMHNDMLLREFVERYDVRYMLLNIRMFEALTKLPSWKEHRWRLVFMDTKAAFLMRSDM